MAVFDQPISLFSPDPAVQEALADLQGNLLKSHGRPFADHVFVQFADASAGRAFLDVVASQVTTARAQFDQAEQLRTLGIDGGLFAAVFLSAAGYRRLGVADDVINLLGSSFRSSMASQSGVLNDPAPTTWEPTFQDASAMVLLAESSEARLDAGRLSLLARLPVGATVLGIERGRAMRNAAGRHIEHFGYVDGRSQPLVTDDDIAAEPRAVFDSATEPSQFVVHCPHGDSPNSFGSLLVFRKLEQNVRGFVEAEVTLAAQLGRTQAEAGALAVGRFRDGTPLATGAAPNGLVENDFDYSNDQRTPLHAHIRKTHPRSDLGGFAKSVQMLRRGITYGVRADDPNADLPPTQRPSDGVGLLFMSYQADIAAQFEFMQVAWANKRDFRAVDTGLDPVIGQDGSGDQTWPGAAGPVKSGFSGFVTLKGGEYFFAPSRSGIDRLRTMAAANVPMTIGAADRLPNRLLAFGEESEDVAVVQRFIAGQRAVHLRLNHLPRRPSDPGPIDGVYGTSTRAAVHRWQETIGASIDGVWGPQTAGESLPFVSFMRSNPAATFASGDNGPGVRLIQRLLAGRVALARRLFPDSVEATVDPGPIDGAFGPLTTTAVSNWQTFVGATPTGIWDPVTESLSEPFVSLGGRSL